ncbi:hypothetical protein J2D73_10130 [Acetobacter sacchari]|uniref:Uncharacterized protein n=1 Tax=Acetobacter sacchari TaxID=2661687 RepID=A0ABS3LW70_9PROT|nr:hypothetical protein [Acetobacter sacchari]MBO1360155.1 hypothetical protein [Acetobacter sacchari]
MTTITIETEGQAPIVIAIGATQAVHIGQPEAAALPTDWYPSPDAPIVEASTRPQSGWKKRVRDYAPGLAMGVLAALVIVGSRSAPVPAAISQDGGIQDGTVPQQPLLPPLPGGPIGSATSPDWSGQGGLGRPRSVNQAIQDTQRSLSSSGAPYPMNGAGSSASRSDQNQGGAPTAGVAPTIQGAPTVGAPEQPKSGAGNAAAPFGLEP